MAGSFRRGIYGLFAFSSVLCACAVRAPAEPAAEVQVALGPELQGLQYADGVVEGEVLLRAGATCSEVVVEVDFLSPSGAMVERRQFGVVPGGDGRSLKAGYAKHFRFQVILTAESEVSSVKGRIARFERREGDSPSARPPG